MKLIVGIFIILGAIPLLAGAATDNQDFTIRLVVGGDTTPPTTPSITSITPLSTSSISFSWSTSTDNFSVDGYQVFRDTNQIATTTQTSFTDTGLSDSTLYTYEVVAFDTSLNYSSTSNQTATTTLSASVTPPATTTEDTESASTIRSRLNIVLNSFDSNVGTSTIEFNWRTNIATAYWLRWGRTESLELGYIITSSLSTHHESLLTDLEPGTTYHYELVAFDNWLPSLVVSRDSFETLSPLDSAAPPNVSNLEAEVTGGNVTLSWDNPDASDFAGVRVLRNHYFFPNDSVDGYLIYQGEGESVVDRGALDAFNVQYYTVYTYDTAGNLSSGAVVFARSPESGEDIPFPNFEVVDTTSPTSTPEEVPDTDDPDEQLPTFSPDTVEIWQEDNVHILSETFELSHQTPYLIRIEKNVLPDHLKSIIVTITDPSNNNRSFSFLLRLNRQGTAYEALISPSNVIGTSQLSIDVFNFREGTITTVLGKLQFSDEVKVVITEPVFPDKLFKYFSSINMLAAIFTGLLFILLLLFIQRRRIREDKEKISKK